MKTKVRRLLIFLCIASFSSALCAQSMYWGDSKEKQYMHCIGTNIYETMPSGVISFKIADNECLMYQNGELSPENPAYLYTKSSDRIEFFKDNKMIGYCIPSQGRFYSTTTVNGAIAKEADMGVLLNGKLYGVDGKVRFTVDSGLPFEVIGIFLFIVS